MIDILSMIAKQPNIDPAFAAAVAPVPIPPALRQQLAPTPEEIERTLAALVEDDESDIGDRWELCG